MPLAPHREVTDEQLEACRRAERPAPPLGSEHWSRDGYDVFDFRHPGEEPAPTAPTSFRWRFIGSGLVGFFAYGWQDCAPSTQKGRRTKKPVKPVRRYAIFMDDRRDIEARKLLEDRVI